MLWDWPKQPSQVKGAGVKTQCCTRVEEERNVPVNYRTTMAFARVCEGSEGERDPLVCHSVGRRTATARKEGGGGNLAK